MRHTEFVSNIDSNALIPQEGTWMTPLFWFTLNSREPEEPEQAQKIKRKVSWFVLLSGGRIRNPIKAQCLSVWPDQNSSTYLQKFMNDVVETMLVL